MDGFKYALRNARFFELRIVLAFIIFPFSVENVALGADEVGVTQTSDFGTNPGLGAGYQPAPCSNQRSNFQISAGPRGDPAAPSGPYDMVNGPWPPWWGVNIFVTGQFHCGGTYGFANAFFDGVGVLHWQGPCPVWANDGTEIDSINFANNSGSDHDGSIGGPETVDQYGRDNSYYNPDGYQNYGPNIDLINDLHCDELPAVDKNTGNPTMYFYEYWFTVCYFPWTWDPVNNPGDYNCNQDAVNGGDMQYHGVFLFAGAKENSILTPQAEQAGFNTSTRPQTPSDTVQAQ